MNEKELTQKICKVIGEAMKNDLYELCITITKNKATLTRPDEPYQKTKTIWEINY